MILDDRPRFALQWHEVTKAERVVGRAIGEVFERLSVAIWNDVSVLSVVLNMDTKLSVNDAAHKLDISPQTTKRWINQGKLNGEKIKGKWFVASDELFEHHLVSKTDTNEHHMVDEIKYLREQISHLTQLLAVSQKSIQQLAEQNQFLLEDTRRRTWWKRIFRRWLSDTNLRTVSISSPFYDWIPFLALAGNGVFRPIRIDIGHFLFNFLRSWAIILLAKHDLV